MNKKYTTLFFISIILFIVITTIPSIFLFSSDAYEKEKSGRYFYSHEGTRENSENKVIWKIYVNKNPQKEIIEDENNVALLAQFRSKVIELKKYKYEIFYQLVYLLFIVITNIFIIKGMVTWKSNKEKKITYLIFSVFIILIVIKIICTSIEICSVTKDLKYYYEKIED